MTNLTTLNLTSIMGKNMKWLVVAVTVLIAPFTQAEDNSEITELLRQRLGTNDIAPVQETEVKGVYQTRFGNRYAYIIGEGRYIFIGDMVDLKETRNLTETARRTYAVDELNAVDNSRLVVFPAEGEEKTQLHIFTATTCGYCQKLHQEIGELQKAGITVRYLPFPRGGNRGRGYGELKQVWCAEDQQLAMGVAKGVKVGELGATDCTLDTMVDDGFVLGQKLGVNGTPAIFTATGQQVGGYVPYQSLIPQVLPQ